MDKRERPPQKAQHRNGQENEKKRIGEKNKTCKNRNECENVCICLAADL